MKILLTAINAKYIHSNLAVYSLKAYASAYAKQTEIAEYTINHQNDDILAGLYRRRPDVIAFSCYIWNIEVVKSLTRELAKLLPHVPIWVGGPEVSYDAVPFLEENPQIFGVMKGEGEKTFHSLVQYYTEGKGELGRLPGTAFRQEEGRIRDNGWAPLLDLDEIPFVYEGMEAFANRIVYYESSRGCPFSCSYCLSSVEKQVRFRSLELVKRELEFFLSRRVPQVKFVDRTFNCSRSRAVEIWDFIREHDNGVTNFHFEIGADLLGEEELSLLNSLRPGLVQLEIGVQSANPETIREICRVMDLDRLEYTVGRLHEGKNIHQHLDLIAGLPWEGYDSFKASFNRVYAMRPQQLQLGFLKVLKGSLMHSRAQEYGIVCHSNPPYEVLCSRWLSYGELLKLKGVEEMVEVYYNSSQFSNTLRALEQAFNTPFEMFESMAAYYERKELAGRNHSRLGRFDILRDFASEADPGQRARFEELLVLDLYLRENSKRRPAWAKDLTPYKEEISAFYRGEIEESRVLKGYEGYSCRQRMNMTHAEVFLEDLSGEGKAQTVLAVFDYRRRDVLTGNAAVTFLTLDRKD